MSSLHTQKIELSKQQQTELKLIIPKGKSPQFVVLRGNIILILSGAKGKSVLKRSKDLKINRETVTRSVMSVNMPSEGVTDSV